LKSQNLLKLCIHDPGVRKLEAARVFIELAFQRWLIGSHALFSPSKISSPLKFEPLAHQILKVADHGGYKTQNGSVLSFLPSQSVMS
jgi:hypothetical protein